MCHSVAVLHRMLGGVLWVVVLLNNNVHCRYDGRPVQILDWYCIFGRAIRNWEISLHFLEFFSWSRVILYPVYKILMFIIHKQVFTIISIAFVQNLI